MCVHQLSFTHMNTIYFCLCYVVFVCVDGHKRLYDLCVWEWMELCNRLYIICPSCYHTSQFSHCVWINGSTTWVLQLAASQLYLIIKCPIDLKLATRHHIEMPVAKYFDPQVALYWAKLKLLVYLALVFVWGEVESVCPLCLAASLVFGPKNC